MIQIPAQNFVLTADRLRPNGLCALIETHGHLSLSLSALSDATGYDVPSVIALLYQLSGIQGVYVRLENGLVEAGLIR